MPTSCKSRMSVKYSDVGARGTCLGIAIVGMGFAISGNGTKPLRRMSSVAVSVIDASLVHWASENLRESH